MKTVSSLFLPICAFFVLLLTPSVFAQSIPAPVIPDRVFAITHYGAVGDGTHLNTKSIQRTIAACSAAGGGEVLIPAGTFLTGPITLASNMNLHLDDGAVLQLSQNFADYPHDNVGYQNCVSAEGCHDISITGRGAIDGGGEVWWKLFRRQAGSPLAADERDIGADAGNPALHRPFMVSIRNCRRVLVRDVLLRNSPMFHLVPQRCRDVLIDGVRILSPARSPNTDGIDPSGWNFLITHCHIDDGDDCIAIKATGTGPLAPSPNSLSCENFTITDCTFLHGHGMSIGSGTSGGLRHLVVRDCTFEGTDAGIRMKSYRQHGGLVEDLDYENLKMTDVKVAILITSYYPRIPKNAQDDPAQPVGEGTPQWRHIRIKNVTATGSRQAGELVGLAEMPISDVTLENVNISARLGMVIVHGKEIHFVNSQIKAETGEPIVFKD